MRVLFFYFPQRINREEPEYSQAIGYLSALLKKNGHLTSCLMMCKFDKKRISNRVGMFKPGLIAMSLTTDKFEIAKLCSEFIHSRYRLPVVFGGPHPTVSPLDCLDVKGVMGVCRGEGEFALLELVTALEENKGNTGIRNFWFKKNGEVIENDQRPKLEDLEILPFPDRDVQDEFNYEIGEIMASRGCPFGCPYCINGFLLRLYENANKVVVYRPVENVLEEISRLVKRYNTKQLIFHDDTFTLNTQWLREFSSKYPKYFNLPIKVNGHPCTITEEVAVMLKKSNVCIVVLGVESGNENLRKQVLGRNVSNSDIINAADLLHQQNIKVSTFNMIGIPNETRENIEETIAISRRIKPDIPVGLSVFKPYPGTEIHKYCKDIGISSGRKTASYFDEHSVLNQSSISQRELSYYIRIFWPSVVGIKTLPLVKFSARHLIIARCYEITRNIVKRVIPAGLRRYISKILVGAGIKSR